MQQLFKTKKVSLVISQVLEKLNHGLEVGYGHIGFLHPFQKFSNRHRLETLEKQIHIDDSVSEGLLIHFSVFQAAVVIIMAVTNLL